MRARCAVTAGGVGDVLDEHAELVAAQTGGGVGRAQAGAQPARDLLEHPVAVGVAASVVGGLEVVEVDEEHGDLRVLARRRGSACSMRS